MAEVTSKKIIKEEPKYCFGDATPDFAVNIVFPSELQLPAHSEVDGNDSLPNPDAVNEIQEQYFDNSMKKADKWDYMIASASALLCSALDILWVKHVDLLETQQFGRDEAEKFVIAMAKRNGFKGEDLKDAIRVLEDKFPIPADKATNEFGGPLQHHLRDFSHHPSPLGLCFSLLTQFTGLAYGTDTWGSFKVVDVSSSGLIGKDLTDKLFLGVIVWAGHLISDMAGSSNKTAPWGVGIPGPILSFLKEFSTLPIFNKKERINEFSLNISKLYNGTFFDHDTKEKIVKFDLRTEIGLFHHMTKQAIPVLVNECVVRGIYFLRRLFLIIKKNKIDSFTKINKIEPAQYLPRNTRELTRMLTVSISTFMLITTAETAVYAARKAGGDPKLATVYFLINVNWAGAVRFVLAVNADAKYISQDMEAAINQFRASNKDMTIFETAVGLDQFALSESQNRILYSLLLEKVCYDIENTKKGKTADSKKKWLNEWETIAGIREIALLEEEAEIRNAIAEELQKSIDSRWLYLVALELVLFEPYIPLGSEYDKEYKKLKLNTDYEKDKFCHYQDRVSEKKTTDMKKTYEKVSDVLDDKTRKTITGAAVVTGSAVLTGGLAFTFAPQIAIVIAGESVAGLSGAALTSASLAYVGMGSLAVGGLGMAGGTAIIVGGGSVLGLLGSGVTMASISALSSSNEIYQSCAKIMTACKAILLDVFQDKETVLKICDELLKGKSETEEILASMGKEIKELSKEDAKRNKKKIKDTNKSLNYIVRCESYLRKQAEKK